MTHTLIEVQSDVLSRLCFESSFVNPTKTGTVPKGFKTENSAAKMLIKSSIFFLQNSPYSTALMLGEY